MHILQFEAPPQTVTDTKLFLIIPSLNEKIP